MEINFRKCNLNKIDTILSYDELIQKQLLDQYSLVPNKSQSIRSIRNIIKNLLNNNSCFGPLLQKKTIVIFAFDGIDYLTARSAWNSNKIFPLTSTFPSISSTAWLTSLTGLDVEQHCVPGVVYTQDNDLINIYTHTELNNQIELFKCGNIFSDAKTLGYVPFSITSYLSHLNCAWKEILVHNSNELKSKFGIDDLKYDLNKSFNSIKDQINDINIDKMKLIWCFINTDDYIHKFGYDNNVFDCLKNFETLAYDLVSKGYNVVAYSDHGQVYNQNCLHLRKELSLLDELYCKNISGGAGRVRWFYPKENKYKQLKNTLTDIIENKLYLFEQIDLINKNILNLNTKISKKIGSLILVAKDEFFPTIDLSCKFDHGALSKQEMIVPLSLWP